MNAVNSDTLGISGDNPWDYGDDGADDNDGGGGASVAEAGGDAGVTVVKLWSTCLTARRVTR